MHNNQSPQEFWDNQFNKGNGHWSGNANVQLVQALKDLSPGTALDLGCGEGSDAVWLAQQGWQVTTADVSKIALDLTKGLAQKHGVEDKINFQQHDFEVSIPAGSYDIVSAQFLQSPLAFDRQKVLQKAATAVAVGGRLIIVEHAEIPSWSDHKDFVFPAAQETYDSLELDAAKWQVQTIGSPERDITSPDGKPATIKDNLIIVKRISA